VIDFKLPDIGAGRWHPEIDTSYDTGVPDPDKAPREGHYPLQGRSLVLLRQVPIAP
jgi:hypothetical protein